MYILRSSVSIPARVPFYEDFATGMIEALARELPAAVEKAMATAYTKAS